MSWGTDFTAELFIKNKRFENIYHLQEEIESTKEYLQTLREKIFMQCASGLPSGCKDIEGNPVDAIDDVHCCVSGWFEEYNRELRYLVLLEMLEEDWDDKSQKWKTAVCE